jgi:hypothetical protein
MVPGSNLQHRYTSATFPALGDVNHALAWAVSGGRVDGEIDSFSSSKMDLRGNL